MLKPACVGAVVACDVVRVELDLTVAVEIRRSPLGIARRDHRAVAWRCLNATGQVREARTGGPLAIDLGALGQEAVGSEAVGGIGI